MCLGSCRGGMGTRNVKAAAASFSAVVAASSSPPLLPWPPPLDAAAVVSFFLQLAACGEGGEVGRVAGKSEHTKRLQ